MIRNFYGDGGVWDRISYLIPPAVAVASMFGTMVNGIYGTWSIAATAGAMLPVGAGVLYASGVVCEKIRQSVSDKNLTEKINKMDKNDKILLIDVTSFSKTRGRSWMEYSSLSNDSGTLIVENAMGDYKAKMAVSSYSSFNALRFYSTDKVLLSTKADDVKAFLYLESNDGKQIEPLAEISYDWQKKGFPKDKFDVMMSTVDTGDMEMIESYRKSSDKPKDAPSFVTDSWRTVVKDITQSMKIETETERIVALNPFDLTPAYQKREKEKKL